MNKYIFLVADRRTGRVLDCRTADDSYSWNIDAALKELLEAHDLSVVDVIIRTPTTTQIAIATDHEAGSENEFVEPAPLTPPPSSGLSASEDDVPF